MTSELEHEMHAIGDRARAAYSALAAASAEQKTTALLAIAEAIRAATPAILIANQIDYDAAKAKGISPAMLDRLQLNESRIASMANGVAQIAALPDPVGRVLEAWDNPSNGLHFEKISVPLGVIGIIYESRPNVTADAAAMCIKSGNGCILRGGSESGRSALAIVTAIHAGLEKANLPKDAVQLVATTDREAVSVMLRMQHHIDVIVPRGGESLTRHVAETSRIPTILHLAGNCHIYVHANADLAMAQRIIHNAKLRRTGICGALESLLIDQAALGGVNLIIKDLLDSGCEVRGDAAIQQLDARVKPANEEDWGTEYLDKIISVKMVAGIDEAIAHINHYGSHHTDAIITSNAAAATQFTRNVDSAIVLVNASTQFADGGEFGFGGEIGIATGRLHARGPVGAAQLTTYKYVVTTADAAGAIRAG
jgi:glutamate-5-semialdehyde dehydrogenase